MNKPAIMVLDDKPEGLSTLLLERETIGGQAGSSSLIRNYLGFHHGISGASLADCPGGPGQRWVTTVVTGSPNRRSACRGRSAPSQRENGWGRVATMISSNW